MSSSSFLFFTLGTILLGPALEVILHDQVWRSITTLTVSLLLMLPYSWSTIRNVIWPFRLILLSFFQFAIFLFIAVLANIALVAINQFVASHRLKVEGKQLSNDLVNFFSAENKESEDMMFSHPIDSPQFKKDQLNLYWRQMQMFQTSYTLRITKFCEELDDLGFINLRYKPAPSPDDQISIIDLCSAPSQSAAAYWGFGQFQAVADLLPIPTISSVLWGAVKYSRLTLVSLIIWLIFIVIRDGTLKDTSLPRSITLTKEHF
jgi:hypothetical protein